MERLRAVLERQQEWKVKSVERGRKKQGKTPKRASQEQSQEGDEGKTNQECDSRINLTRTRM